MIAGAQQDFTAIDDVVVSTSFGLSHSSRQLTGAGM
jgi:hypothetical protein